MTKEEKIRRLQAIAKALRDAMPNHSRLDDLKKELEAVEKQIKQLE